MPWCTFDIRHGQSELLHTPALTHARCTARELKNLVLALQTVELCNRGDAKLFSLQSRSMHGRPFKDQHGSTCNDFKNSVFDCT